MTDIEERQELENKIKQCDMNLFAILKDKSEPDEEFRDVDHQHCELIRQYRMKYGLEAECQLYDKLDEARKAYVKQYVSDEQMESQNGQINGLRQHLSEMDATAKAHAYEIMDIKRRILDELYKFPVVELLDVLLELQKGHKKDNENGK